MATVSFYPLDIDYVTTSGGKTAIRIFGRTKKGKSVCVYDERFRPYFWVLPSPTADLVKLQKEIAGIRVRKDDEVAYITAVSVEEKRYIGKARVMLQVFANAPQSVPSLREEIQELRGVEACLEADIHFYRRYLIDTDLSPLELVTVEGEVVDEPVDAEIILNATSISHDATDFLEHPRILAFDIEVASKIRIPDAKTDPIVMISFYGENYQKVLCVPSFKNPPPYVEFVEHEAELLVRFKEIVKEYDPDYLVGYFSDGFDFPYIRARAQKYRIKLDLGKDGSAVKFSRSADAGTVKIVGIAHIDIYKFLRRVMIVRLGISSLDLHSVATHLIGEGKVKSVDIGGLYEAIESKEKPLAPFCEYNLQDARITYKVTLAVLPHLHEFVKLVGLPADDVCRMSYGRLVESYLLRQARQFKEIAPNRPMGREMAKRDYESYVGAFVHEPVTGLHKDLVVFDFKSLYPSIITAHNICVSTLTQDTHHSKPSPPIQAGKKEVRYYFDYTHDGFIPLILREILVRRSRIKEIMKKEGKKTDPILDARQYSLKTLANSFYGYFGFSGARWYSNECAAAITAYGRQYIQNVIKKAKKDGFQVIYGDSVGGDTKIVARKNDEIFEEKIENLFENTDFKSSVGKEYNFKDRVEVLTLDERGNSVFKPVIYVMRHSCKKKMYKVRFTNDWDLDVTEDHSLIGYQSLAFNKVGNALSRLIEMRPDEIKKRANSVVCLKSIPRGGVKSKEYHQKIYEFIGYFIGDGSFTRNKRQNEREKDYYLGLSLGLDKKEVFHTLINPLISLGYITNYWWSKSRRGDIRLSGLKLVGIVSEHCRDGKRKVIPEWLFHEREENIRAFLRGLFSADGTVIMRNNAPIIRYTSIQDAYINQARKLLYRVGVSNSIFKGNTINRYKTKKKTYSSGSKSKYVLVKDTKKFVREIGFLLARKNKKASRKTDGLQKRNIRDFEFDIQSVKNIVKIKKPKYVYDLEVKDTHRFFANYVLVHNTDSIFISLGKNKGIKDADRLLHEINTELPSLMELELEGYYPRGLFVMKKGEEKGAKKKYALIDEKGKIKVTGFETIRGDWSVLAKEVQKKVIETILAEQNVDKAVMYVRDVIKDTREGKIPLQKMVIHKQLRKDLADYESVGPHVEVAKAMAKKGYQIRSGMMISYVIDKGEGKLRDKARLLEDAQGYDADYYIDNQILPAVGKIFEALGYSEREIAPKEQKQLDEFS